MRLTTRILAAFNQWTRWSEGHIFAFTPEQIGIIEGIRASVAIAVMLAADLLLHIPDLAFGAVAAFWTCLCDPGGPDRPRLRTMASFGIGATLAMSIAAYCAHWGVVAGGITLFVLVLLCGLTRSYRPTFGPMPTPSALIVAIAVVVGVTSPRSAVDALELAGCFLLGALWAAALCIYVWPTHPRAPARRALVAIFARLEDMTLSLQRLDREAHGNTDVWAGFNGGYRRAVRLPIERGREIVARLVAGRTRFTQGIDAAGRVFAALMALGHYRAGSQPFDPSVERPLLDGLRRLLHQAVHQSDKLVPDPEILVTEGTALLGDARGRPGVVAHAVAIAAGTLVELARHWQEPEPTERAGDDAAGRPSFKIPAPVWRQALRVATAVSASYAIGAWYDLSFSYWGTIAALVIMQPLGANTWLRIFERAAGSIIGGVLTAILIARLSGPLEMVLFIAPLAAAVIALRLVNYGLFMIFLTPMFVLTSDFIHPASDLISARAINEVMGACIGLAGSLLLWPEKEGDALSDAVLAALSANMAFACGMLRAEANAVDGLDPLRRDAGLTSTRAEIARQRMLLQGRSHMAHLDRVHEILVAVRAICGAANVLAIVRQCEPGEPDRARAERYDTLTRLLREEFKGSDERAAIASLEVDGPDDLSRTVHSLVLAIQDYAAEARETMSKS
jgi:uncharacterized membrane protein YccC